MGLNKEVAQKWVEALRSGEYEQGGSFLRPSDTRFCCLGVLCDLAAKEGLGEWVTNSHGAWLFQTDTALAERREPTPIGDWAGFPEHFGGRLAKENDIGRSFATIASMIEKEAGIAEAPTL